MKRWIAIVMSCVPVLASAAGFWDGNATLQRGDSSFESGLFAASNSFAPDTEIQVENLETGKTARVTVRERAGSQSSILVLLSPKAAEALDISPGTIARVRITIAPSAPSELARVPEDRASSPDPDINPAAAFGPAAAAEALPAQVEPEPAAAEAAPAEAPQVETAQAEAVAPEPTASPEDEQLLQELAARTPQKQLFLPPREDEKFAYQKPVEPPAEAQQAAGSEQAPATEEAQQPEQLAATERPPSAEPAIESVEVAAAVGTGTGAQTPLAEAQAPLEVKPEVLDRIASASQPREKAAPLAVPEPLSAEQKKAAPVETPIAKTEPKAEPVPEKAAEKTAEKVAAKPPEQKPVAAAPIAKAPTPAGKTAPYYVQLAAYSAESLASGLAASLSATYPVLVLAPPPAGKQIYRVLIGPLNRAESGTLLNWFRYRGFPDAFVKRE
jgi:cell division septation protein DedD